jgi:hypothetical protein
MKVMRRDVDDASMSACIEREVLAMKSLDHPFIVALYDVFNEGDYLYLITEFVDRGTILDLINKTQGLPEDCALRIFYELILALQYLHEEKHTCHGDIKPENILLDANGHIRLADFGFARVYSSDTPLMLTSLGSPAYVSPEFLRGGGYGAAADIWSAGVVLFAMVSGRLPFTGESTPSVLHAILESEPDFGAMPSPELGDLVKGMLSKDPAARLTIREILTHPWLARAVGKTDADWFARMRIMEVAALDEAVTVQMRALRIDTGGLLAALNRGDVGGSPAIYKMLKREGHPAELELWHTQRSTAAQGKRVPLSERSALAKSYENSRRTRFPMSFTLRRRAREAAVPPIPFPKVHTYANAQALLT